jgi:hypothetical protein
MRCCRYLLLISLPVCLLGQEVPRSTEYTDNTKFFTDFKGTYRPPSDMTEPSISNQATRGVGVLHPEPWPEGATFMEAKSLPFDGNVPAYVEDNGDYRDDNGRRVLALQVQPGEKLEFNMTAEASKLAMRAFIPVPPPALKWKLALRMANQPLRSRRAKHFEVRNPTAEPQTLFLILYGVSGYSYRVELARTAGK